MKSYLYLSVIFLLGIFAIVFIPISLEENYTIPSWIKNNAKWWSQGQIGDSDFIKGIQWLIQNKIIVIPQVQSTQSTGTQIPSWIKNNAGWWADNKIPDDDFVKGIQYLVQVDVIHVDSCNTSLWDHVYNSDRLQVIEDCKTITGTIEKIIKEKDGDDHIRLKLDPQFTNLTNYVNDSDQNGDLVIEPICLHTVTQEDAIDSCQDFNYTVDVPPVGTHVQVTGSYVLDTTHGWNEIHPVTSIEEIPN
jgi:hypothetical protein